MIIKLWVMFACLTLLRFEPVDAAPDCDVTKWQLSKLNIELNDTEYLKMVMGFSYGTEVMDFIPKLKLAQSNMYYAESKAQPLLTFFRAEYKDEKAAIAAFDHLKSKWLGNKNNQYDVFKTGRTVVWYGNNRLEPRCFYQVVAKEKNSSKL